MADQNEAEKNRSEFLMVMYKELMNDINRHIVVIWQSVAVLFGAFAAFALVEKQIITLDVAATLIMILCVWVVAHVYDAGYWYNRNLVIIANIERQFLRQSDLRDIHYYFARHRASTLITHLKIQLCLALGVAVLVLSFHFMTIMLPIYKSDKQWSFLVFLPWAAAVVGLLVWWHSARKAKARYKTFVTNSPGKEMDDTGIIHGPGHTILK
jgi:hypothetical protein